jgi:ankyrin repeat protein
MLVLLRPNFYKTIIGFYILLHTIGFGICLHSYATKDILWNNAYDSKYKNFIRISNHLVEQANDVAPFLGTVFYKLKNNIPVDINQKDVYGRTALHYAAQLKNPLFVNVLLVHGADLETKDPSHRTALQIAAAAGNLSVVRRLLIIPTIQVNSQDQYAETALYVAAEAGHASLVEMLLSHPGTIVDLPNFLGKTAFTIAFEKKLESISTLQEKYNFILSKIAEKANPQRLSF